MDGRCDAIKSNDFLLFGCGATSKFFAPDKQSQTNNNDGIVKLRLRRVLDGRWQADSTTPLISYNTMGTYHVRRAI